MVLAGLNTVADTVSKPKRLFGLGSVQQIAISPDLRFMATAGQTGSFVWDVETSTLRHRLEGIWSSTALAFSPDGKVLAVAGSGMIVAWDPESGARLQEFSGHRGEINRLRFSADGRQLFSGSADNTVRVWLMETGAEIRSFHTPGSPISDFALSPDGQKLATIDSFLTNCVKIWDIATESLLRAVPKTNWTSHRCLFTPDGNLLTTQPDRSVLLWNTETTEQIRSFTGITGPTVMVSDLWLPNETTVAAACSDGNVYLWNLESGQLLRVVAGEPVIAAVGVPNDHLTIAANLDYNVRLRQLPGGDTLRTFKGHTTSVHSGVAFSPDGRYVLSGGTEMATRLWDRQTAQPIREFTGSPVGTMAVAFSPDGSRVLTTIGLPNPAARLWKTDTGELEREFRWSGSWPMGAVFSRDGNLIATRSQGEGIRVFETATGILKRTLPNTAFAGGMAFSPSAPLLAAASADDSAVLYNYESGQLLHTFSANAGPVTTVAFSPNGDTLMVAWQDGLIHLYNAFTMDLRREIFARAAFLNAAAYSPDGRFILTGEGWPFFTATIWDAQRAEPLRIFEGHKWEVSAVGFSADGKSILTGADAVREWSITGIASRLRMEKLPNETRLIWALGELQHAAQPTGPWQTLTNAISPLTIPANERSGFYRVQTDDSN